MNQSAKDYVIEKVKELMNAFSCCADAKEAAQNWLDAIGTDQEKDQAKNLIAELEDAFNIEITMEEMSDLISYEKGIELLGQHGIHFQ